MRVGTVLGCTLIGRSDRRMGGAITGRVGRSGFATAIVALVAVRRR